MNQVKHEESAIQAMLGLRIFLQSIINKEKTLPLHGEMKRENGNNKQQTETDL